jgi:hypothetical protein
MKGIQRFIALLVLVLSAFHGQSQIIPLGYDTLKYSHEFFLDAGGDYYGSSVERDLLSKFIRGGMITEEIKDNSFNRHKAINRFGAVMGGEFEYRNYNKKIFKKKDWGFVIKGGYHVFAGMLYSKDLFGLAFYGNESYMGETIDISGTDVSYMNFQKIGFGMIDSKSKSSVSLNVYNISDRFSGDFRTVKLFQDLEGDEVTLEMDGEVDVKNNKKFNQGIGFGLDLDFKVPVSWGKDRKAFLRFQAQNLGFAYMYEKQKVYSFDTTFTFDGLTFNQLIGDDSFFGDSLNILDSLGIRTTEKNRTVMLPGFLQIGKIVDEHYAGKVQSFFGLRLYPSLIYSPYIFAGVDYRPAKWARIGANVAYGGFGGFRAGLYTNLTFDKYSVGVATENILGFFTKKASGQSLFIRLRCAF